MIPTSLAFQNAIAQNTGVLVKADLVLADGTEQELSGDDFMLGGVTITQAVSSAASFDIGSAIVGTATFRLNNSDGRFDEHDFTSATIRPYFGKELDDGTVEWVRRQKFYVDQPSSYGQIIELSAMDGMGRFQVPYSDVPTGYPAQLGAIVEQICEACGVVPDFGPIQNPGLYTYVVERRPDDAALTCLSVLSYVAQIFGGWYRIGNNDRLLIQWYDLAAWEQEAFLDGGSFEGEGTPYPDGDDADGGDFDDYDNTGDDEDGGDFESRPYVIMTAFSNLTLFTDDVVITGIEVTAQDDLSKDEGGTGNDGETFLFGEEGYVLKIEGNPFVQYGSAQEIAEHVAIGIVGMRFRPFQASVLGDPSIEAGDPVLLLDRKGNPFQSHITSYTYKLGGYATAACAAETPRRNSATAFSAATEAIVDLRNQIKKERSARQLAIESLNDLLSASSGLYSTEDEQDDGSIIYYFHDKPTLAESTIVWKFTAEAMGISTDGGASYPYGLDVSGSASLEKLSVTGIDASVVTISNLMSIGDVSANHMNLSGDSIDMFLAEASSPDLSIGIDESPSRSAYIGSENSETAIAPPGTPITLELGSPLKQNGEMAYSITIGTLNKGTFDFHGSFDVSEYDDQSPQIGQWFLGGTFNDIHSSNPKLIVGSDMSWNGFIRSVACQFESDEPVPVISNSDDEFLTRDRFSEQMAQGRLYTGLVQYWLAVNNIQRNYKLWFENGLLVDYYFVTPTSDEWDDLGIVS